MKSIYLLTLFLFQITCSFSQKTYDLHIAGISKEAEQKIVPGDRISYFNYENGNSYNNVRIKFKSEKGSKRIYSSLAEDPDANNHYTINHKVQVKESSKVTFEGEFEILISVETIYKNVFWTKVTRTMENLRDPIILDHYTNNADKLTPVENTLYIQCRAISKDKDLKEKVTSNGDSWEDRSREDFHIYVKNEGDTDWKVDQIVKLGKLTNGLIVDAKIEDLKGLDLSKKLVVRTEVKTEKGNLLWNEVSCEPHEIRRIIQCNQYKINSADSTDPVGEGNKKDDNNIEKDTKTTNVGKTEVQVKNDSENDTKTDNTVKSDNSIKKSGTDVKVESKPVVATSSAATDLTTKTVSTKCKMEELGKGDTIVAINGSKICIDAYKFEKSKYIAGTVAYPINIEVNGVIFPLAGNSKIEMNKMTGNLVSGTLRSNMTYSNSSGEFELKEGTEVRFDNGTLYTCSITEDAVLKTGDYTLHCTKGDNRKFDLRFDNKGNIVECTVAEPLQTTGDLTFNFPAKSRFIIKNEKIWVAFCPAATSFELEGKTYQVAASPSSSKPSYEFKSNLELEEVICGDDNSMDIEGQTIEMQAGEAIEFEKSNGRYYVTKFYSAKEVNLKEYGRKVKDKTVKAGKKIVLEEGKVVKAG